MVHYLCLLKSYCKTEVDLGLPKAGVIFERICFAKIVSDSNSKIALFKVAFRRFARSWIKISFFYSHPDFEFCTSCDVRALSPFLSLFLSEAVISGRHSRVFVQCHKSWANFITVYLLYCQCPVPTPVYLYNHGNLLLFQLIQFPKIYF